MSALGQFVPITNLGLGQVESFHVTQIRQKRARLNRTMGVDGTDLKHLDLSKKIFVDQL